jgi:glycosyltransferase involved in cell wall biosynthesis
VLSRQPSSKAEELLIHLLQNRGISIEYELNSEIEGPLVTILDVSAFDHRGISMLYNELQSTQNTVHLRTSSGDLIATCEHKKDAKSVDLEHHVFQEKESMQISTVHEFTFKKVPSSILIAGHDLKFAMPIVEVFREMGIEILVDKWDNHNKFDAEKSRVLLSKADAVWCEWALGNVEWYSSVIKDDTPLFVRYHLQEQNYEYLNNSNHDKITNVSFVCKHYEENARNIGQVHDNLPTSVIPNILNTRIQYTGKNDNFSIGFVGMVPARKRLDLALDLLEKLLQDDRRYTLKIVGKKPEEYAWLMKREKERDYYQHINNRIESNPLLKSNVKFLGYVDDIREFYSSVGHVISTSDFESFHLTLADGPVHGAAAHTLKWEGAANIYTEDWLNDSIEEMAQAIINSNQSNLTGYHAYRQSLHLVKQMSPERVGLSILEAMYGGDLVE